MAAFRGHFLFLVWWKAAGIEPASQTCPRRTSTCVFGLCLSSPSRGPVDGAQERQPEFSVTLRALREPRGLHISGVDPNPMCRSGDGSLIVRLPERSCWHFCRSRDDLRGQPGSSTRHPPQAASGRKPIAPEAAPYHRRGGDSHKRHFVGKARLSAGAPASHGRSLSCFRARGPHGARRRGSVPSRPRSPLSRAPLK